jgi:hypothetical protein
LGWAFSQKTARVGLGILLQGGGGRGDVREFDLSDERRVGIGITRKPNRNVLVARVLRKWGRMKVQHQLSGREVPYRYRYRYNAMSIRTLPLIALGCNTSHVWVINQTLSLEIKNGGRTLVMEASKCS